MNASFDRVATVFLLICAAVVAGAVVRREFLADDNDSTRVISDPPQLVPSLRNLEQRGVRLGPATARVQIVEFADLECPYCKAFHASFRAAQQQFPNKVALVFLHFPLDNHRFARPAALALECAATAGQFDSFLDLVFAKQDSLGLKSWTSYAKEAGVLDSAAFARCITRAAVLRRVEEGRTLGDSIGVRNTPTIIVNGWRYPRAPAPSTLPRIVSALLEGKTLTSESQRSARP